MDWMWIPTTAIILLCLEGTVWLIYRWVAKKPAFKTKQGVTVYTHLNSESSRTKKKEIEVYLDAFVDLLVTENLFTKQQLLRIISKVHLFWKIQPFWDNKEKRYVSGKRIGNHILVGWNPYLERTTLAHELMHIFLEEFRGTADADHILKPYWALCDGLSGPK